MRSARTAHVHHNLWYCSTLPLGHSFECKTDVLSLRLVGMAGTGNYVSGSFSRRMIDRRAMTRSRTQGLLTLRQDSSHCTISLSSRHNFFMPQCMRGNSGIFTWLGRLKVSRHMSHCTFARSHFSKWSCNKRFELKLISWWSFLLLLQLCAFSLGAR